MDKSVASPWLAVSIGIIGLVIGYSAVLSQQDSAIFARSYRCESTGNACASGVCTKECPHNCIDLSAS